MSARMRLVHVPLLLFAKKVRGVSRWHGVSLGCSVAVGRVLVLTASIKPGCWPRGRCEYSLEGSSTFKVWSYWDLLVWLFLDICMQKFPLIFILFLLYFIVFKLYSKVIAREVSLKYFFLQELLIKKNLKEKAFTYFREKKDINKLV